MKYTTMTHEHLMALLDCVGAKPDQEGWSSLPDGRSFTLYAARTGVPLTVAKVEAIATRGPLLRARTGKGELYVLATEDLFAVAADAAPTQARKAGFL